jgi:RNA polymerase sigma-70 factor (ECF subfamily)
VAAGNRGDAAALAMLYERYRAWALRVAWRFAGETHAAQDVVQDAFLYWLRQFPGFRLSGRLSTYLYPIVKHGALAWRRRQGRGAADEEALAALVAPESSSPSPAGASLSTSDAPGPALRALVARLPAAQQEVLLMCYVDDLTLAEIAAALAVPLGTVKSRLHAALAALRDDPRTRELL